MQKMDLGKIVDSSDVFQAMQNSSYMKGRGYDLFYVLDIVASPGNDYRLCFYHDKDMIYVHIRGLEQGLISSFKYLPALGDLNTVASDMDELTKELKKNL